MSSTNNKSTTQNAQDTGKSVIGDLGSTVQSATHMAKSVVGAADDTLSKTLGQGTSSSSNTSTSNATSGTQTQSVAGGLNEDVEKTLEHTASLE